MGVTVSAECDDRSGDVTMALSDAERAQKRATSDWLNEQAAEVHVEVGQVWQYLGPISLMDRTKRVRVRSSKLDRIRIVQVAGDGRARTTRFVKVDPPRGGNGGYDRQDHPITHLTLVRSYALMSDSPPSGG
ncbi:hypothetical protein [Gordonia malaquae]|uniref:hypothetical protein n=1 Tax=Gordonia malaquae TaxID=410332 RepID=UPI00301A7936